MSNVMSNVMSIKEENRKEENRLAAIVARVAVPAHMNKENKGPILIDTLGGKKGLVANWQDKEWEGLKEGDRLVVELSQGSTKRYEEYRFWIGRIIGRVSLYEEGDGV